MQTSSELLSITSVFPKQTKKSVDQGPPLCLYFFLFHACLVILYCYFTCFSFKCCCDDQVSSSVVRVSRARVLLLQCSYTCLPGKEVLAQCLHMPGHVPNVTILVGALGFPDSKATRPSLPLDALSKSHLNVPTLDSDSMCSSLVAS